MKKFTIFLFSLFTTFGLMAQLQIKAPSHSFPVISGQSNRSITLYDQLQVPTNGTASQVFPDYSNCVLQTADDFIVPAGGWTITNIDATGSWGAGSPQPYLFTVVFYADAGGIPGAAVDSVINNAYVDNGGVESITLNSSVILPAGHYWISVMIDMPSNSGGQWFWAALSGAPAINDFSVFRDPCNLVGISSSWTPASSINSQYTQCSFALYGTTGTQSVPVSNWAIILGIFLMILFMAIHYRRRRLA